MELNEFTKVFAEQFENTDISTIKSNTAFKDIDEWDSLMALTIIAMVDDEYNAKLTGQDIREANTVEDLFEKIKFKI